MGMIDRLDRWVGHGIDAWVCAHHRRRLGRAGRARQLDPPDGGLWAEGDPPPRGGNDLELLVDGEHALPRSAEALAGARSQIWIAGWHITPEFGLARDDRARRLRDLLGDLAERVEVRVLLWAGAPLPVFSPRRRDMRQVRDQLSVG